MNSSQLWLTSKEEKKKSVFVCSLLQTLNPDEKHLQLLVFCQKSVLSKTGAKKKKERRRRRDFGDAHVKNVHNIPDEDLASLVDPNQKEATCEKGELFT